MIQNDPAETTKSSRLRSRLFGKITHGKQILKLFQVNWQGIISKQWIIGTESFDDAKWSEYELSFLAFASQRASKVSIKKIALRYKDIVHSHFGTWEGILVYTENGYYLARERTGYTY